MADKRETRESDTAEEEVPSSEEDIAEGSEENVDPVPSKTLPRAGNLASKRAMLSAATGVNIPNTKKDKDPFFLRHTSQSDKKKMFEQQVDQHKKKMSANPFSDSYKASQPRPHKDDPNYGRPPPGSKTEMRGKKAAAHINNEVVLLCNMIYQEGERYPDHTAAISFGDLFQIYTRISNKVVGVLLRARKHGLVFFEGEVLFQRRDDDVPILLAKPIEEIRAEMRQDIQFDVGICHQNAERKTENIKLTSGNNPSKSSNSNSDTAKAHKPSSDETAAVKKTENTSTVSQVSLPMADAVFSPSGPHSPSVEHLPVIQNSMKTVPLLVSH